MNDSSECIPLGWQKRRLGDLGEWSGGQTPLKSNSKYWQRGTILWVSPKDIVGLRISDSEDKITPEAIAKSRLRLYPVKSVLVVVRSGILRNRFPVARCSKQFTVNQDLKVLVPHSDVDPAFVFFVLNELGPTILRKVVKAGTTVESVDIPAFLGLDVPVPRLPEQQYIARILTTLDNLIEKTESLIAKYQAVKQGVMHDLFTRGVDAHGKLRPPQSEAPDLYKQSELGWIPKEWEVAGLESRGHANRPFLRTGPFGSALKSDHWVGEGIPVITIGSLGEGVFICSELLHVTEQYAKVLAPFALVSGDIVFSRVADVGRSVVATEAEHGWIMSSNLMRISLDSTLSVPYFAYLAIAFSASIKTQIRQSVNAGGRDVANSNVMSGLRFTWPPFDEQHRISTIAQRHDILVDAEQRFLQKTRLQKIGLMRDLLTGRARVRVDINEEASDV